MIEISGLSSHAVLLTMLLTGGFLLSGVLLGFKFLNRWSLLLLAALGHVPFLLFSLGLIEPLIEPVKFVFGTPQSHFALSFYFDGLSSLFFGLISLIGIFISIFAFRYFKSLGDLRKAIGLLYLFAVSMYGMVCADNLLLLFIFWELTTIVSFLLISFKGEDSEARKSALQALLLTGMGGLALLLAILSLAQTLPSPSVSQILNQPDVLSQSPFAAWIFTGLLLAIMTKSAQFPFHYWLPGAMKAPTPVSAYLHSATMVKAGIFLYARLYPAFQFTPLVQNILILSGGVTATWGVYQSFRITDLKLVLAYTTVSALGMIMLMLGSGYEEMAVAGLLFLATHAIYKSGLFISLGSIEKIFGHRDLARKHGLFHQAPVLSTGFAFLTLSMMGIPPFLGFLSKESSYMAGLSLGGAGALQTIFIFIASVLTVTTGFRLLKPLIPLPGEEPAAASKAKVFVPWLGAVFLGTLSLAFGLFPSLFQKLYFDSATTALLQKSFPQELSLWHGLNWALGLSILTLALGFFAFRHLKKIQEFDEKIRNYIPSLVSLHETFVSQILRWGLFQTPLFFPKDLKVAVQIALVVLSASLGSIFYVYFDQLVIASDAFTLSVWELAPLLLTLGACILVFHAKNVTSALLGAGLSGFAVILIFVFFSAPDLALTQILVETFVLITLASLLYKIPLKSFKTSWEGKISSYVLPLIAAGLITFGHALIQPPPLSDRVSADFAKDSYVKANGKNVVNVILVDFRGMDTLGELTVLGIAALGAFSLMRLRPRRSKKESL